MMQTINPATEEVIGEYVEHAPAEIERRLEGAQRGFEGWRKRPFADRGRLMAGVAKLLRERTAQYSQLMTREMGKPIAQAEGEIEKCAAACEYFAEHAGRLLANQPMQSDASRSYVRYDPLGPILAIMPWNFPFWQVFRFAAPNLMAGNVALLKHAANVSGEALAMEQLFLDAGLPPGVFTALLIDNPATEKLIHHPLVRGVTLTGSTRAGKAVGANAGQAIKKSVLELGGSDPFIVLRDVEIGAVVKSAVAARCLNSGQSCIAAKRFIVEESIAAAFAEAFAAEMARQRVGDPADRLTQIGPLARKDLRDHLAGQVQQSIDAGAAVLTGGHVLPQRGYYYAPTVLGNVVPGMAAFDEELFGPVAAVIRARDARDAVRLANFSPFGLGASIWTKDTRLAENLAAELESGNVFINGLVKSDPRLPFGGVKQSGYGRELAEAGIREFVNIKTVWIGPSI
jgi:succinate-semialdehyde dehydrogenase/glutarate-semialdehyde dehydrogenase